MEEQEEKDKDNAERQFLKYDASAGPKFQEYWFDKSSDVQEAEGYDQQDVGFR